MIHCVIRYSRSRAHRSFVLLALSLALFPAAARSQTQLGTVFGTITDTSGAVLPEAEVTVVNVSTGLKRDGRTDMSGQYQLAGLPAGRYTLKTEKEGFQTELREGIALSPGAAIAIKSSLRVGTMSQQVTVSAEFLAIDNTTSTVIFRFPCFLPRFAQTVATSTSVWVDSSLAISQWRCSRFSCSSRGLSRGQLSWSPVQSRRAASLPGHTCQELASRY
jgi:hypothetical protein